jgi:integrase
LRLGRYLRSADDPEPEIDPLSRDEVAALLEVSRHHMPDWYPWLLCGLRTGMRAGELLALQWGDLDWRGSYAQVRRNIVRGQLTTPKNHQRRRMGLSVGDRYGTRRIERPKGVQPLTRRRRIAAARIKCGTPSRVCCSRTVRRSRMSADSSVTRTRRSRCACTPIGCPTRRAPERSICSTTRNHPQPRRNQDVGSRNGKMP